MNRGDLTTYISILGKHSSIVLGQDISSQIVDEFSLFSGPLDKSKEHHMGPPLRQCVFPPDERFFWRRKLNSYPNLPQQSMH